MLYPAFDIGRENGVYSNFDPISPGPEPSSGVRADEIADNVDFWGNPESNSPTLVECIGEFASTDSTPGRTPV